MSKLAKLFTKPNAENTAFSIVQATQHMLNAKSLNPANAMSGMGLEDFNAPHTDVEMGRSINEMYQEMRDTLSSLGFEHYGDAPAGRIGDEQGNFERDRVQSNQMESALIANLYGGLENEGSYRNQALNLMNPAAGDGKTSVVMKPQLDGPNGSVSAFTSAEGLENYNEKSSRDFRVVSMMFNLSAARQDEFGETLYPTVVVNPAEGGVVQNVTYAAVLKDVYHKTTGQLWDPQEVNMVEAYRRPSILEDTATILFPVVDPADKNKAVFVDPAVIPPRSVDDGHGGEVLTAPLAVNQTFDLLGVSNQAQLNQANLLDLSDTIDPAMRLKAIYVKTTGGVIRFQTSRLPSAVFTPALVGDSRNINLTFNSESLSITGAAKLIDGSTNAAIDEIASRGWTLRIGASLSGHVSTSRGSSNIMAGKANIVSVFDTDGQKLTVTGDVQSLVDSLGTLDIIGYDLEARFTNTNRRKRGQLVQTRTLQYRHPIPMLSPITLPISTMDKGPGEVVKTLTVLANIRASANAVTRLQNYVSQLKEAVAAGITYPQFGEIEGALGCMMRPTYRYKHIDLVKSMDSVRSKDRYQDVAHTILNTIYSVLFEAYPESNIEAAFKVVTGDAEARPKFIIACDKQTEHYLMRQGDDRTLGAKFKYEIVSTNNENMDGKIYVLPTSMKPVEDSITNFGQFYYVPTIIADLNISRDNATSREIAAIPFNLHVNNIPFALEFDINGLKDVMGDSAFNSKLGQTTPEAEPEAEPTPEPTP